MKQKPHNTLNEYLSQTALRLTPRIATRLYIVDVVVDVVVLIHLDGEELAPYEEDVGQAFGFVNVAQCPPRFHGSFASFDMRQFFVHQTHGNDGEGLLASSFVRLLDFVARGRGWWQLRTFHNLPKILGGQRHLQLELIEVEVLATELVNRYKSITLTRNHFQPECKLPLIQCSTRT